MRIACATTVRRSSARAGFTIVEVVVALAVLSVATYIAVSLYTSGYAFAATSGHAAIAMDLAEMRLIELEVAPGEFAWPEPVVGAFGEIAPVDTEATYTPEVLPTDRRYGLRARNLYERFTVRSLGRLQEEEAGYAEILVVVTWLDQGRERVYTLSSALPRATWGSGS